MTVITRFAPSPTGYLHIGGARTALFNWLYARHCGGKFLLRIEDTDRARSTEGAIKAIFQSLKWLNILWDDEPVFQSLQAKRHTQIAHELLKRGHAYPCYCTPEELEAMKEEAKQRHMPPRYNGKWRDKSEKERPLGIQPTIRFKAPQTGEITIDDAVQGKVTIQNKELDDMVLLRADGTPTYMLSVVVDDHDMNITHIIRGDDHLTNAFRQYHLYQAMGWAVPHFSHIPLIHGSDGAKLSKRHGALSVEAYKDMGFLSEALCNYLLRLGWGHGDHEIISTSQAIEWFTVNNIGKSPSRLDIAKLTHLNAHYLKEMDNHHILQLLLPFFEKDISASNQEKLLKGMNSLKLRARTLLELKESAAFYTFSRPIFIHESAQKALSNPLCDELLLLSYRRLSTLPIWSEGAIEQAIKALAEEKKLKLGELAQPLRAALTGSTSSPGLFEVMHILGAEETLGRLQDQIKS